MIRIVSGDVVGHWVASRMNAVYPAGAAQAIGLERDWKLVAGMFFENYTGKSMVVHIAADYLSKGFLHAVADYCFRKNGVHKIIAPVDSVHKRAVHLVTKMGFTLEAIIAEATAGGDLLLFTMKAADCRYLGEHRGKTVTASIA